MPARRRRAASMSAIVGAIELEHLLEELPDGAERIELAVLDSGEHALEPGVGGDRLAQVGARTARGDGEHLGREVLAPPRLEPAVARERFTMGIECPPQLGSVLAAQGVGQHDLGAPIRLGERDDRAHFVQHRLRALAIHLVDRDHVGNLHDPRLQCLHRVARAWHEDEEYGVRDPRDLDLALARTDRLDEDDVLPRRVEEEHRLQGRLGEPPAVPARPHRPDVPPGVPEVVGEADPVAEKRPPREGARGVDGYDADRAACLAQVTDEGSDEARLSRARRPGHAEDGCLPRLRVELAHDGVREWVTVLDERDRTRESPPVCPAHALDELLDRPVPPGHGRTLCPGPAAAQGRADRRDSRSRRASISSRSVAIRSRPPCRLPFASTSTVGPTTRPFASAATASSELVAIASCSSLDSVGSQRVMRSATNDATRNTPPAPTHTACAPTASVRTPAAAIPSPMTAYVELMSVASARPR